MIPVRNLLGIDAVPKDRTSASKWLERHNVRVFEKQANGGTYHAVKFEELPLQTRTAFLVEELGQKNVEFGDYDDDAHAGLARATPSRRDRAERKAAIALTLTILREQGIKETERFSVVRKKFGSEGTSTPSLKRLLKAVKGVAPINFAPALLDKYTPPKKRAEMSEDAWRFFMTLIRDAAPEWPLKSAWRDTRDAGRVMGWDVPSYSTFYRRWADLDEAQRVEARLGYEVAAKRLTMPAHRDKSDLAPLSWVSLDGRMLDFWVDWGDGKAVRPIMLALVDVASNVVLDWELAQSENAVGTVRLIKRTCERYGIFDRLYTDNGSAFAGHLVAGGNVHRFRNGKARAAIQPLGICQHMGIKLHFALPKNAQAKIAERTFATLSRVVDDRPEFKNAHAGHAPGANPSNDITPIPVDRARAILNREIGRHNSEPGRRSQGANGRSYMQVFESGIQDRVVRKPTARQIYLSGLIWKPAAVDRYGQVTANGWIYGGPSTQSALLRYHGTGKRILLGCDPDDFSAPAIAFDEDGRLICEGIEAAQRGAYDSADGVRDAARKRKAARSAVKAASAATDYLEGEILSEALAALDHATAPKGETPVSNSKVVGGHFTSMLRATDAAEQTASPNIPEYHRNMDDMLAAERRRRGKSA